MPDPNEVDLTDLDNAYAGATEPPPMGDNVPDGTYQVVIEGAEVRTSEAGNRMLSWDLRVLAGEHKGRHVFKRNMMQTPENLSYLKADLGLAGLVIAKLSDLTAKRPDGSAACDGLKKTCLEVKVKQKGDFLNVYFQKRMGGEAAPFTTANTTTPTQTTNTEPAAAAASDAPATERKAKF